MNSGACQGSCPVNHAAECVLRPVLEASLGAHPENLVFMWIADILQHRPFYSSAASRSATASRPAQCALQPVSAGLLSPSSHLKA
jgi:hypothetical protein